LLELMLLKRPKENTKRVSAAGEELTAAKHKLKMLELKLFRDAAVAAHMKLNKVKSSKLRRLKKVGTSQRIESSEDEGNVFNQERISVDIDEWIELVDDQKKNAQVKGRQADTQAEIYNIDLDHTSKVLSMHEDSEVQEVIEVVNVAKLMTELEVVADEDDDVFIEATPIGTKVPVVNYEIVMLNNKPRYKIFRADDTHQLYTSFITFLKNFDREDLEDL
nr:hypothetical protein [Tanacetum cinerariifolium]